MFGKVGRWRIRGGCRGPRPGPNSRRGSPIVHPPPTIVHPRPTSVLPRPTSGVATAGLLVPPPPTPAVTARRSGVDASPISPSTRARQPPARRVRWCRTPNCTAIPTSRFSPGHRIPKSWWRKPNVWSCRRWPSPITTVSTAWCVSPRPRVRWDCPRCSAATSPWTIRTDPGNWWCWPTDRRVTRTFRARSAWRSCRGAKLSLDARCRCSPTTRTIDGGCSPVIIAASFRVLSSIMVRKRHCANCNG